MNFQDKVQEVKKLEQQISLIGSQISTLKNNCTHEMFTSIREQDMYRHHNLPPAFFTTERCSLCGKAKEQIKQEAVSLMEKNLKAFRGY